LAASAQGVPGIDRKLTPPPAQQQQHTAYWSSLPRQGGKKGSSLPYDMALERNREI